MMSLKKTCTALMGFLLAWHGYSVAAVAEDTLPQTGTLPAAPAYSEELVTRLVTDSAKGDPERGAAVFASAKFACISCHQVGEHGGKIGPELTKLAEKRQPAYIVESLLWPKRQIEKEFAVHRVVTTEGQVYQGFLKEETKKKLVLRNPATGETQTIPVDDIDAHTSGETLMPEGLMSGMSAEEQTDLIAFLTHLGGPQSFPLAKANDLFLKATAHARGPTKFEFKAGPIQPEKWPHHTAPVNAYRLYDFYEKQADYFYRKNPVPPLLQEWPGLEHGTSKVHYREVYNEVDSRWDETDIRPVLAGVYREESLEIPRAVCVRLGEKGDMGVCFNPQTLCYEALWSGEFLKLAAERHGLMGGLRAKGKLLPRPEGTSPTEPFVYHGYYRHGDRILFSYRIGDVDYLDSPWSEGGEFQRFLAPASEHPLRHLTQGGAAFWPDVITCPIELDTARPYAVDNIPFPFENPHKDLMFGGGVAFLQDGAALVCTMQGDVWRAEGFAYPSREVRWRKVASGMFQALGIVADHDGVFVIGRDQITRLHDLNGDGEYDFHECFCNSYVTSTFGHDFICGLERDAQGNFYTVSGNQGLLKISPNGKEVTVIGKGLRNPDGVGVMTDGTVTTPCSQGNWTPASMICAVAPDKMPKDAQSPVLHFGFGGPRDKQPPELPLVYLPRGLDNSSGGQTVVDSDRWGPLQGQLLHFSFGACRYHMILVDEVDGQRQGAVVPMYGDFLSGVHRGKFNPHDGQLYAVGQGGWGAFTVLDGCLARVRYTGDDVQLPVGFHVFQNGVRVDFSSELNSQIAEDVANHFAQCWNYRYSASYGSPEFSPSQPNTPGHDPLKITSAHVLSGGKSLFLEIPELQPVNQLQLRLRIDDQDPQDLFLTVHKLDQPFTGFSGYTPIAKTVRPHPILADMAYEGKKVQNPWKKAIKGKEARKVSVKAAGNLQFEPRVLKAEAGETLQISFDNADVVPHNWVLIKPGKLESISNLAALMTSDPDAYPKQYIPKTGDVVVYADITDPGKKSNIYFTLPTTPGDYPYVCTFPGHSTVMHGILQVRKNKK
ncbi:DUF6797 domain-containing protein [Planctomicrobium sp. SH664]|uniref:DUF6797 domain-containing protein n=1 Tax=Planctomicrobium sp. SH664 TaxID=3448125 RepID=UPI003F5AEA4F